MSGAVRTVEAHAAGEPLRVLTGGVPEIPGATMLAKRQWAREHLDGLRRRLMWEPRGHADMYGAIPTRPVTPDGDLGVLFLHNEGFSTMCGHGVIALVTVALETGLLEKEGDAPEVRLDTPAGRVTAVARRRGGKVAEVTFRNVPSFALELDREVEVPELGTVLHDLAFGGAFYAFVDAAALGLRLVPDAVGAIVAAGKAIKEAVRLRGEPEHPESEELSFLYGTIFTGPPEDSDHHSRHVCVFADGEVDRSPTGTGVSGRAALLHLRGDLPVEEPAVIESILGTTFTVRVAAQTEVGGRPAVVPEVTGSAWVTGQAEWSADPADPLGDGFLVR